VIKVEEAAKLYNIMSNRQAYAIDHEVQPKDWLHPADTVKVRENLDEQNKQIYTDGSKSGPGVGAGIAIFIQNDLGHQPKHTLLNRRSNNQAEKLAIFKALEIIGKQHINDNIPRSATVHADSRITLQFLQNTNNYNYLKEEIRKLAITLGKNCWTIKFTGIKVHVGFYGEELADKLGKAAGRKHDISFKRIPKTEITHQQRNRTTPSGKTNGTQQQKEK